MTEKKTRPLKHVSPESLKEALHVLGVDTPKQLGELVGVGTRQAEKLVKDPSRITFERHRAIVRRLNECYSHVIDTLTDEEREYLLREEPQGEAPERLAALGYADRTIGGLAPEIPKLMDDYRTAIDYCLREGYRLLSKERQDALLNKLDSLLEDTEGEDARKMRRTLEQARTNLPMCRDIALTVDSKPLKHRKPRKDCVEHVENAEPEGELSRADDAPI